MHLILITLIRFVESPLKQAYDDMLLILKILLREEKFKGENAIIQLPQCET